MGATGGDITSGRTVGVQLPIGALLAFAAMCPVFSLPCDPGSRTPRRAWARTSARRARSLGSVVAPALPPPVEGDVVEVTIDGMAGGGDAVGRAPDGRALFVAGALPGEQVRVEVAEVRRRHARGVLVEVSQPAPARRDPPCPHVAEGCGGCDWQHVADEEQRRLRRTIVADALTRIGRVADPVVVAGPPLPSVASRTTVRAVVTDGRAGFRRRRSHQAVVVGSCLVTHPAAEGLLVEAASARPRR